MEVKETKLKHYHHHHYSEIKYISRVRIGHLLLIFPFYVLISLGQALKRGSSLCPYISELVSSVGCNHVCSLNLFRFLK